MRLILRQSFPLGRFHATFWKANPFDKEVAGEWPPSPWRLTRAVVARWYQWRRETTGTWPEDELEDFIRVLCSSEYSFYLPEQAFQVVVARQYQPAEFGMDPPNFKSFEAKYAVSDDVEQKLKGVADSAESDGQLVIGMASILIPGPAVTRLISLRTTLCAFRRTNTCSGSSRVTTGLRG